MGMLSGGLAGLSRFWWLESGGFDSKMMGWGGENIDQGVRMWVCGGEIVAAPHSQVAHMWRTHSAKTSAHYKRVGDTLFNRARAIKAWLQEFSDKLYDYPAFASRKAASGEHWIGETCSNWLLWTAFFFFSKTILSEHPGRNASDFRMLPWLFPYKSLCFENKPTGKRLKKTSKSPCRLRISPGPWGHEHLRKCSPETQWLSTLCLVSEALQSCLWRCGFDPSRDLHDSRGLFVFFLGKSVEPDYLLKIFERKALRYISCHH